MRNVIVAGMCGYLALSTQVHAEAKKKPQSTSGEICAIDETSVMIKVWGSDGIRRELKFELLDVTTINRETGEVNVTEND